MIVYPTWVSQDQKERLVLLLEQDAEELVLQEELSMAMSFSW